MTNTNTSEGLELLPSTASAPVKCDAPVGAAQPVEVALDDVVVSEADAAEEARRREAYEGDYLWRGKSLLPLTPSVMGLWDRLCAMDMPLSAEVNFVSVEVFQPQAAKLLFLLTHAPESYRDLRGQPRLFVEYIEKWWDKSVPWAEIVDAATLALRVINDAKRNMVMPKPATGGRHGRHVGE